MAYIPPNPNGQATSANSAPVVLPNDYASTVTTKLGDGTNTTNILKSDGTAAGQNAQLAARTYLSIPFSTSTVQAVATTDVGNYAQVSVHFVTQGTSSTVTFQGSNDNTNWVSVGLLLSAAVGSSIPVVSSGTASTIYSGPINFRYFRLNVTGITAGTTAGQVVFFTASSTPLTSSVSISASVTAGTSPTSLGKAEDAAAASGDTGVFMLGVRRDAVVASASATGDYNEIRVDQYGQLVTTPGVSGTDTITRVTASATSVSLLAANTSRKGAIFYNESTAILYLKYGTTASNTSYTVQIAAGGYFELPSPVRQGAIDGIWSAANGAVMITESI